MGLLGRLGCNCRQRRAEVPAPAPAPANAKASERQSELDRFLKDPLMGAASEADAELAGELKEQGNEKYKKELYQEALDLYTEAVQLQQRNGSLWLNRSMANRQLKNWEDAEEDAELACALQPDNPKAHYSRALCLQQLGRLEESLASCRAGLKAQPDNKALQQLLAVVKRALQDPDRARPQEKPGSSTSTTEAPSDSGSGKGKADKVQNGEIRRRKRILTQEEKQKRKAAALVDITSSPCPVSQIQEKAMNDVKKRVNKAMYDWKGQEPSREERDSLKGALTDMFRQKYSEINAQKEASAEAKRRSKLEVSQYDKEQKQGLQLKGGHQPMERPEHVDLPDDFKKPMGIMTLDQLKTYSFENPERRYFISVYGNIFDVSDRPDKYGPDGPYTVLTGADITWGLAAGVDAPEYVNRCFDLFKAKDMGADKIAGVCSWLGWYWHEYGDPVGQLDQYQRESELPAPPLEEIDDQCCIM